MGSSCNGVKRHLQFFIAGKHFLGDLFPTTHLEHSRVLYLERTAEIRDWREGLAVRTLAALAKDLGSGPSTHMVTHKYL